MRKIVIMACGGIGMLSAVDSYDTWPPSQTVWREENNRIVTIHGDIRRDTIFTSPAVPIPRWWTELRVEYSSHIVEWPTLSPFNQAAGRTDDLFPERRRDIGLLYRQQLWSWVAFELKGYGSWEDRTESYHWGDPETNLIFKLAQWRYSGIAMELGALQPVGDKSDWLITHGDIKTTSWTGHGSLRATAGIGLCTLAINGGASYTPRGTNEIADPNGDMQIYDNEYTQYRGAAALTVRMAPWIRVGVEQEYKLRQWKCRDGDEAMQFNDFDIKEAPTIGTIEVTPGGGFHVMSGVGYDWERQHNNAMVVRVAITFIP